MTELPDAGPRYRIQRWDGKVWVSAGQQPWDLKQNAVDVANDLHKRHGDSYRVLDMLMNHVYTVPEPPKKPTIVCLCGSTRFSDAFRQANLEETLAGRIVLTIGCDMRSDAEVFKGVPDDELAQIKSNLDELHLRKIDLADEVLILNVDGYIGQSTQRELNYATELGKPVRFLESGD